jgi:hypothetical protein
MENNILILEELLRKAKAYDKQKERVKKNTSRYQKEHPEKCRVYSLNYYYSHKQKVFDINKRYYERNKEKIAEQKHEYYLKRKALKLLNELPKITN